jgi:hypothetical protein
MRTPGGCWRVKSACSTFNGTDGLGVLGWADDVLDVVFRALVR